MLSVPTWLDIDREAVRNNVRLLNQITQRPVMAIVKANAYGHGLTETARAAVQGGAAWLGVSRLEEGLVLRHGGIDVPILVLGLTFSERVVEAAAHGIRLVCFSPDQAHEFSAQAQAAGRRLQVHAKFDTGMSRLGIWAESGLEFIRFLNDLPGLEVEGAMTHLAEADDPSTNSAEVQLRRFDRLLAELDAAGLRPAFVHAANSAAALHIPHARYDLVRPGIAVYGLHPSKGAPLPAGFLPALSWKARLASLKMIPPGQGVSYNYRYITTREERIGVCPAGYADGLRRALNVNHVLIRGRRVPVVGSVCMDQCLVQLDHVPDAKAGDEIVLIGEQDGERITAEEIAASWNTVNYEVVCGLSSRVPRSYHH